IAAPSGSTTCPLIEASPAGAACAGMSCSQHRLTAVTMMMKMCRRRRVRMLSVLRRKSTAENTWVGLLAWREQLVSVAAASPSPADDRVAVGSDALTHSGGTAPDSHRTSLLCPT